MWHEARKQERLVRSQMVDSAKRSERRKIFYESIRREPEEFMQIHGRKCIIHMDANVATAAESSNILRKWQGDSSVLIDRFDVRSHLDHILEVRESNDPKTLKDNVQELQCEYERYRILVFNEYSKISERTCLNRISAKEFWPASHSSIHRREVEKKKKLIEKKAAIGFSYADSETVSNNSGSGSYVQKSNKSYESGDSGDDSSDMEEIDDIKDVQFNVDELTPEQGAHLNKLGAHYNIGAGVFLKLFRLDCKEMHNNAEIKEIDKAKLALSGRQAKADRAVLKRRRALIVGKVTQNEEATTTLLSFLANKRGVASQELDSSSESGGEVPEKTEFITSFGGDDDEKDEDYVGIVFNRVKNAPSSKAVHRRTNGGSGGNVDNADVSVGPSVVVQGPVLPTKEYRRLLELKRRRSTSSDAFKDISVQSNLCRRSNSKSPTTLRFASTRRRPSSRSRSPRDRRRSRSTSYRRYHESGRRVWSDRERKRRRRHSSSFSRSSSSSASHRRHNRQPRTNHSDKHQSSNNNSNNGKNTSRVRPSSGSRSSSARSARSNSVTGPDSPLSIHSSMSEEEREQREIENRKRRIRRVKREVRQQRRSTLSTHDTNKEVEERKTTDLAKKLRQQMHKSLKKTAEQLKQEEAERIREQMRERKQREDELLEEARLLRMKEREKRKQEEVEEKERRKRERQERHSIDAISAAVNSSSGGRMNDVQLRRTTTSTSLSSASRRRRSRSGSRSSTRPSSSALRSPYYRGESTTLSRNYGGGGGEGNSRR